MKTKLYCVFFEDKSRISVSELSLERAVIMALSIRIESNMDLKINSITDESGKLYEVSFKTDIKKYNYEKI